MYINIQKMYNKLIKTLKYINIINLTWEFYY